MHCAPVIVLRAWNAADQGIRQLENAAADARVVLLREHDGGMLYYVFGVNSLRRELSRADPAADLASALHLDQYEPAVAGQLLDATIPVGGVALEGWQVIGVMVDEGQGRGTRGGWRGSEVLAESVESVEPMESPAMPPTRGCGALRGASMLEREQEEQYENAQPAPPRRARRHRETRPPEVSLFRAYPDLAAPAEVASGDIFELSAGFSVNPHSSTLIEHETPILVPAPPEVHFVVQVTGFGFTFPEGIRRTLVVERDHPETGRVDFIVRAGPSEITASRVLEVSYEFEGIVVGRTWAQIQVAPSVPADALPARATVGSSGLISATAVGKGPQLSVDIFSRAGDPELHWVFHCRYPGIDRPEEVITTLEDHSAQSFAIQLMNQLPNERPGRWLAALLHGVGDAVADALPSEFWPIFEQTWQRARADGEEPRLQITTTEPWIPWELAWVGDERLRDPHLLPPDSDGRALGQLWQIGRWTPPTRHLAAGDLPPSPPVSQIEATEMAVIIGNYTGERGTTELPQAVEEGNEIAMTYGALPLPVSDATIVSLMDCTLHRDNQVFRPTIVHFAGHGETDVNNPQFTGLVLRGGKRLDPLVIRGFELIERQRPFVFLNACEAGVAGEALNQLGGLAGAFLVEGARGFIAPLWKVNDVEARDIALEFYRLTLDEGRTVGEAMREIRRRYTADSTTTGTALAYVFYGNPDLRLKRSTP